MLGIQRQEQGAQGADDLSPDGRYVQVSPDADGDGQPNDRRRRQTPDPLTLPAGLGQHKTNGLGGYKTSEASSTIKIAGHSRPA